MKIAITSQGSSPDSEVDPRFGRSKYFIIYNDQDNTYKAVDNTQNLNAAQGAGIQAAQNVVEEGAKLLFTGNCGPKAFSVLNSQSIGVISNVSGKVKDVVEKFNKKDYELSENANVEEHW